jgi:long-chain fatty acid transport protein
MKSVARSSVLLGLLAASPSPLVADGFGIYEHGARASGMAGAWVARVMDASAIYYNVAGMNQLSGTQLYVGASAILNSGNGVTLFDGRGFDQEDQTFYVPHLYLTHEVNDRVAVGVGLFSPYGLGTGWNNVDFPGRFRSYEADIRTIYVQPSASFAPSESFSIGAGVDLVYADVGLNRQSDLSTLVLNPATGTTFGQVTGLPPNTVAFLDSELEANGTGFGFNVGVLLRPSPAVQFGLNYRSQVTVDFDGDATFTPVPTNIVLEAGNPLGAPAGTPLDAVLAPRLPVDQAAQTEITLPDQVIGGVSFSPSERWMLNVDVQVTFWDDFDIVELVFVNENPGADIIDPEFETSATYRIGGEYLVNRSVALRAGYVRDENPSPERSVTPLLPDADRNDFSLGLGFTTGAWQIDVYWLGVFFKDRDGVVGADDDIPDGTYDTTAHLVGLDFGYRF